LLFHFAFLWCLKIKIKTKKSIMTNRLRYLLLASLLALQWACYPKGAEYTDELDLVYTNYTSDFDFTATKTYSIPDSIVKISGDDISDPDGDGKPQFLSQSSANVILNQIKQNMSAYGWTLVDKNDNPDVVMLVSTMTTTNIYYYYDWWYWGWYYPGYSPGWGWYYPGYYYPPYITGYRSGSIFTQMVDNRAIPLSDNATVVWTCIINGLAEGGSTNIAARTQINIDKAYDQSPYLNHQ
jgi:hypothetical protein